MSELKGYAFDVKLKDKAAVYVEAVNEDDAYGLMIEVLEKSLIGDVYKFEITDYNSFVEEI